MSAGTYLTARIFRYDPTTGAAPAEAGLDRHLVSTRGLMRKLSERRQAALPACAALAGFPEGGTT